MSRRVVITGMGVVSPNGCGKSNVIDAVRWVLVESEALELCGSTLLDVICNGPVSRKPASRASVDTLFDNSECMAQGQWAQYAEISVKRMLTRSGDSSYYINNIQVRRKDVYDLFLGTGLGGDAYAIIEQGMISRIIESRPEDLRAFLEEAAGVAKLDLVGYYLAGAEGALQGVRDRPMALKRFVNGAAGEAFFQKRAPDNRPDWLRTVTLSFPSGRTADEIVLDDAAGLAWIVNLGCIDLNPHPVRADDLEHPDELRVDLDPVPGVPWDDIRRVALVTREVLADHDLVGWPKTSGSRGIHINVRIEQRWTFDRVRRAALALAREVERRAPALATSKWWKEERHGVFLDYNQNAPHKTVFGAWSLARGLVAVWTSMSSLASGAAVLRATSCSSEAGTTRSRKPAATASSGR